MTTFHLEQTRVLCRRHYHRVFSTLLLLSFDLQRFRSRLFKVFHVEKVLLHGVVVLRPNYSEDMKAAAAQPTLRNLKHYLV